MEQTGNLDYYSEDNHTMASDSLMHNCDPGKKNTYSPPELVCFGRVRDLTEAGSAGPNEGEGESPDKCTSEFQPNKNTKC
jgi:hypothetical protein